MASDIYNTTVLATNLPQNVSTLTSGDQGVEVISHEEMLFVMRILMYGVTPGISVLGIIGNIFSIVVLLKHGLHKSSNILLVCLAVTDIGFLVAFNSVPKILYEIVGKEYVYEYSKGVSYLLLILFSISTTMDYAMGYISLTIPMLITTERLVAVYLPFKFHLIITPMRTWCTVAFLYVFWFSVVIYMSLWFKLSYEFDDAFNNTVGTLQRSALYDNFQAVKSVERLCDFLSLKIPPVFTLVGCIFISVKVQTASKQRKKMTQASAKEASSNRTTRMLLGVCVVYVLACAATSLPSYIPQYMYYSLVSDAPSNLSRILYQVMNTVICLNSSCNFIIYVGLNKNFRDTYKSLFHGCISSESKK